MKTKKRKYISIILCSLALFLVAVGFSTWIILSEQTGSILPFIIPGNLEIKEALTVSEDITIYAGNKIPDTSITGTVVDAKDRKIPGKWSINTLPTYNEDDTTNGTGDSLTIATKCNATFTPSGICEYLFSPIETTVSVNMHAVSQIGSKYYVTVDLSLASAVNGNTIKPLILTSGLDTGDAKDAKTMTGAYPIPSGVIFALQHTAGATYNTTVTSGTRNEAHRKGTTTTKDYFADSEESSHLKNQVSLSGTLTNNGTIVVGGQLGTQAESGAQGHVTGDYAQITMCSEANIINNGTIDCLGYIKDENNDSFIQNDGMIYAPFIIFDYAGPSATVARYCKGGIAPFGVYDMPNIFSEITTSSNATIKGYVDLYTQANLGDTEIKQHNLELVSIYSSTNALINLPNPETKVVTNYTVTGCDHARTGRTSIIISGGAESGNLSLRVKFASVVDETINMSTVLFPVSWKTNITLEDGDYYLKSNYKFLPGSKLTVGKDANVEISKDFILYPSTYSYNNYPSDKGESTLLITDNGHVNIKESAFGGYITTDSALATLSIENTVKLNLKSIEGTGVVSVSDLLSSLWGGSVADACTFTEVSQSPTETATAVLYSSGKEGDLKNRTYNSILCEKGKYGWYPSDMKVTFMANGAEYYSLSPVKDSSYNGIISPPESAPEYDYYTFSHWCVNNGCTSGEFCTDKIDFTTDEFYEDTILYAAWTANAYDVTFNATGGTFSDNSTSQIIQITYGNKYTLPSTNPTRTGYTFSGWESGGSAVTTDTTMLKGAHTVTAKWDGIKYTVTLNAAGGTFADGTEKINTEVTFGSGYINLPTPTKSGYVLIGWTIGDVFVPADEIATTTVSIADHHELTAVWEELTSGITIILDVNGTQHEKVLNVGASLPKSPDNMPQHYTFDGWSKTEDGECLEDYTLTAEDDGITFYAQLTPNSYTVTYYSVDDNVFVVQTVVYGSTFTLPEKKPTREGFSFIGWYTAANGGNIVDENYEVTGNVTLYAHWIELYTVTYNANGGTVAPNSETTNAGESISLPTPTRTGYKFLGWYTLASGGTNVDDDDRDGKYTPKANITLYAQWEKIAYKITYSNTAAQYKGPETAYYGDTVTVNVTYNVSQKSPPTVKGASGSVTVTSSGSDQIYTYTFTMPAEDVTMTITGDSSCIVEGTLITLANGTQKKVEDLVVGDMVLVFNHVSGKMEAMPVIFNNHADQQAAEYDVLHLLFSNGKEVKIVSSHGFFDMTLLKYVYITNENYTDYIGHEFYYMDENGNTDTVKLTEAFIQKETTRIFCPVTYFHMNSFANGFLNTPNIPGDITGLVNYFEYDPDLKYNEEKMQADIEKYGLYTYEDFSEYMSEEAYNSSPAVYLKVALGKGMITQEEMIAVIEYLLSGSLIH